MIQVLYKMADCTANVLIIPIVVMTASCFFGWTVSFTKKTTILLSVYALFVLFSDKLASLIMLVANPKLCEEIWMDNPDESTYQAYRVLFSSVSLFIVFLTLLCTFLCYLTAYESKKVLRAFLSSVVAYLTCQYVHNVLNYFYIYYTGGKWETEQQMIFSVGPEYAKASLFCSFAELFLTVAASVILYFGFYREKHVYIVRKRKILWVAVLLWAIILMSQDPFTGGGELVEKRYEILCHYFSYMLVALGIFAPVFLIFDEARNYLKKQNQYQQHYLEAELDYIAGYKEKQRETRAFRHDMVNQLALADMLMDNGKTEEARKHIQELIGNIRSLSSQFSTGDEMLDCIVSMKAEKMRSKGIDFSLEGIVEGGLSLKPMEVCSIFANALDNSIEAAEDSENPNVSMVIRKTNQFWVIDIANSIKDAVNVESLFSGDGYTTKEDKKYHGFGLSNIKRSIERNDGLLKINSSNDRFVLSIMLPRDGQAS